MPKFALGKREAVRDYRVPLFATHRSKLPPAPETSNWYANVPAWGMLANDQVGDCVEAAALHMIYQQLCYTRGADTPPPADRDALALYSAITGYTPNDPATDQGTIVMGPQGLMQYWHTTGIPYGGQASGQANRVSAFMRVSLRDPAEWRQSIALFGSLLVGLQVPTSIVDTSTVPEIWSDASGPIAGGHEILLCGYQPGPDGTTLYRLVSWGGLCWATEAFLQAAADEMVVAYDRSFLLSTGLDPAGLSEEVLLADMRALQFS